MASMILSTRSSRRSGSATPAISFSICGSSACRRRRPAASSRRTKPAPRSRASCSAAGRGSTGQPMRSRPPMRVGGSSGSSSCASRSTAISSGTASAAAPNTTARKCRLTRSRCASSCASNVDQSGSAMARPDSPARPARPATYESVRRRAPAAGSRCIAGIRRRRAVRWPRRAAAADCDRAAAAPRAATGAQPRLATTANQLQRLRQELDLANATGTELDVVRHVAPFDLALDHRLHFAQALNTP